MTLADMVLVNGKLVTVDKDFSFKEAVAVKDGWIINVGANEEIKNHIGPNTQVIDLGGKLLLPGAVDTHVHATFRGFCMGDNFLDFYDPQIDSIGKINEKLQELAHRVPPGTWIFGAGFIGPKLRECIEDGGRFPR